MTKPYSQACENNKRPILAIISHAFADCSNVLEIGSGTGQHAVFFAQNLPTLQWHTSDQPQYHQGIELWIDESKAENLHRPLTFTVGKDAFPKRKVDGVFSANTAHIMQPDQVKLMMEQIARALPVGGIFCQYGPFTENGSFNSQSNAQFHQNLLDQGYGGYRDIDELVNWASPLRLLTVNEMPASNLLLVWQKT